MSDPEYRKVVMTTFDDLQVKRWTPFLKPIDVPEFDKDTDTICVPISIHWIPYIIGCLRLLIYPDQWRGDLAQQQWAEQQMRGIIDDIANEVFCMDLDFRNDPDDGCIVQYSKDGGTNWLDGWDMSLCVSPNVTKIYRYNTNNYRLEFSINNGTTWENADNEDNRFTEATAPLPTGGDVRCKLAENITANMRSLIEDLIAQIEGGTTFIILMTVITGILLMFVTGGLALPLVINVVSLMLAAGAGTLNATFNDAFWDEFKCIVLCALADIDYSGVRIVLVGFALDEIVNQLNQLGSIAGGILGGLIWVLGPVGITNAAAMGNADGLGCADCSCPEEWCYEYNFLGGDELAWTPVPNYAGEALNTLGWQSHLIPTNNRQWIIIALLNEMFSNAATVEIVYSAPYNLTVETRRSSDNEPVLSPATALAGSHQSLILSLSGHTWDSWYFYAYSPTNQTAGNGWHIERIIFRGGGANPLGATNCV